MVITFCFASADFWISPANIMISRSLSPLKDLKSANNLAPITVFLQLILKSATKLECFPE